MPSRGCKRASQNQRVKSLLAAFGGCRGQPDQPSSEGEAACFKGMVALCAAMADANDAAYFGVLSEDDSLSFPEIVGRLIGPGSRGMRSTTAGPRRPSTCRMVMG